MALEGKSFLKGYGIWRKKRGNTRKGSSQATPTRPSQFSTAGPSQVTTAGPSQVPQNVRTRLPPSQASMENLEEDPPWIYYNQRSAFQDDRVSYPHDGAIFHDDEDPTPNDGSYFRNEGGSNLHDGAFFNDSELLPPNEAPSHDEGTYFHDNGSLYSHDEAVFHNDQAPDPDDGSFFHDYGPLSHDDQTSINDYASASYGASISDRASSINSSTSSLHDRNSSLHDGGSSIYSGASSLHDGESSLYDGASSHLDWESIPDGASYQELESHTKSSRPSSLYPYGDFRNNHPDAINDIKCEVMVNWLHSKQEERIWTTGEPGEGVVLKRSKGRYVCCPYDLQYDCSNFFKMITKLNIRVAITVNTRVIRLILARSDLPYVELTEGLRLQVIPDITALPNCQKHQSAAFVAKQQILIVWEDNPQKLLDRAAYIQDTLMKMIWGTPLMLSVDDEKNTGSVEVTEEGISGTDCHDIEGGEEDAPRRIILINPLICGATLMLVFAAIGGGWRNVAIEIFVDHGYIRLLFILCTIPQIWLALFFFQALMGNVAQLIGPVGQVTENTKFFSGISPKRLHRERRAGLPHVTIQMPVYKEGLHTVIEPTIRSIKTAISTYELQGGTANVFINDDGMQLLPHELARERQDFYDENNIGWVARPKHNPRGDGSNGVRRFNRAGKFKKASNMNYAMWVSVSVEKRLANIYRGEDWNQLDENRVYADALQDVVEEQRGEIWADGNIRMGDYILLIDSDTRVPQDCFLEAVSEMEQSPRVAILQYSSGVMNVTDNFFERGITFFTNLVYTQIRYAVANGDVAPFVGHNAILRWTALQEIAYPDDEDEQDPNREKYWSEKTVSEDFDMALRLQTAGYIVRLGAYKGDGFKEGVSLTVYDELARWEKYAYGCNELIFFPLASWPKKGCFTPLFKSFIVSRMPLPSKVTIMAYIGTYYALGSAWFLTLLNYFVVGWYNGALDHYYVDSFKVYFAIIIVFTVLGNIALAILRYRISEQGLGYSFWENFKWVPLLVIFLGGISIHVSQALLCHMFGIDMSWGATAKEVENVSFFEEIPRVIKRFKFTFLFCFSCTVGMIVLAQFVPQMWRITFFTPIWPTASMVVCHFLLPIVLNPNLMLFTW